MEKYILTFEDGSHSVSEVITEDDKLSVMDGLLTIIRCSDAKMLSTAFEWEELPKVNQ
jgi:hypothetical protein